MPFSFLHVLHRALHRTRGHARDKRTAMVSIAAAIAVALFAGAVLAQSQSNAGNSAVSDAAGGWHMHASSRGGYSFRAPSDWIAEEPSEWPGNIAVHPPVRQKVDEVSFGYLSFERPENEDLIEWLERYYALGLGAEISREIVPANLDIHTPEGNSQQAAFQYMGLAHGHGYYITNGRLVLMVSTSSTLEAHEELMQAIVESLEFRADAPTTQRELWYPMEPANHTTIEDYLFQFRMSDNAVRALELRMQTGEDPVDLLTSDDVRERYERLLEQHAREVEIADQYRGSLGQSTPSPNPDQSMSVYEEKEREYNWRLLEQGISPLAIPTPTATPAVDSPLREPGSPVTADNESGAAEGLIRIIYPSIYGPEHDSFAILYDPDIWEVTGEENSVFGPMPKLALVDDAGCRLRPTGGGMAWPLSAVNLAGREWTVYDDGERRWSYSIVVGRGGYIFILEAPAAYIDTDKGRCQIEAEKVIDTFTLIPPETSP